MRLTRRQLLASIVALFMPRLKKGVLVAGLDVGRERMHWTVAELPPGYMLYLPPGYKLYQEPGYKLYQEPKSCA